MKKIILIEEDFEEEQDYPNEVVEALLENDELSAAEAAFMRGYEEAG